MQNDLDPVDDALKSLRSEQWAGTSHNQDIEDRLMAEFRRQQIPGGFRRYRTAAITLAVVLIGGVGFAATGGAELVERYVWVHVIRITGDDSVQMEIALEPVEDGDAEAVATIGSVDGENTTITIHQHEPELTNTDEEVTELTVSLNSSNGSAADSEEFRITNIKNVSTHADAPEDGESSTTVVIRKEDDGSDTLSFEPPADSDMIWDWVDDNGLDRELRLIPEVTDAGVTTYSVLTALRTDNDMTIFRTAGSFDYEGEIADVLHVLEDEDGTVTLELLDEDGFAQTIELPRRQTDTKLRMTERPGAEDR